MSRNEEFLEKVLNVVNVYCESLESNKSSKVIFIEAKRGLNELAGKITNSKQLSMLVAADSFMFDNVYVVD